MLKFVEQIVEQERACHARQPQRLPNNRTSNQLILHAPTVDFAFVTAEVAGSSPIVPAILFTHFLLIHGYIRLAHQPSLSTLPSDDPGFLREHPIRYCLNLQTMPSPE